MLKTYKPKEPIKTMQQTEELPLIVQQKRFLTDLIEGGLSRARELESLPDEERYKRAFEFIVGPDKSKLKRYMDDSSEDSKFSNFLIYLESLGIAPAWDLKDEPKSIRDRVVYLSLRGIRKGHLDYMSIFKISDPFSEKLGNFCFNERNYDFDEKRNKKTGELFDPIKEQIKNELIADQFLRDYFFRNGYSELFKGICFNIALHIADAYGGNFLEE